MASTTTCEYCHFTFKRRSELLRHSRVRHGVDTGSMVSMGHRCSHEDCRDSPNRFSSSMYYRKHLHKVHKVENILIVFGMIFFSMSDFENWKEAVQKEHYCRFYNIRGMKKCAAGKTCTYSCHRTGTYKSCGVGKRRLKSQGSCKAGIFCPASIVLTISGGLYYVKYYPTHFGHSLDPRHLKLSAQERRQIAGPGICSCQIGRSGRFCKHQAAALFRTKTTTTSSIDGTEIASELPVIVDVNGTDFSLTGLYPSSDMLDNDDVYFFLPDHTYAAAPRPSGSTTAGGRQDRIPERGEVDLAEECVSVLSEELSSDNKSLCADMCETLCRKIDELGGIYDERLRCSLQSITSKLDRVQSMSGLTLAMEVFDSSLFSTTDTCLEAMHAVENVICTEEVVSIFDIEDTLAASEDVSFDRYFKTSKRRRLK